MFETVEQALRDQVANLDVAVLSTADARFVLGELARIRKLVDGAIVLVAQRAADSGAWKAACARSPEEWMAREVGTTTREAGELLATSARVEHLDDTAAAVRAGQLSAAQAAAVATAAVVDPAAEARLLERARYDTLTNLRAERDAVVAAARTDDHARRAHWRRTRCLVTGRDADGAGTGRWRLPPEHHAEVLAAIRPYADAAFDSARLTGERESSEAYAADGLLALARAATTDSTGGTIGTSTGSATGHGARTQRPVPTVGKLIARVDHTALARGATEPGETCEIAGIGPVPVSVITGLVATGDVFLTAVVTRGTDVCTVAHLGRHPTAHQLTALHWRDPTCRIQGCPRPVAEWDHHTDWATTHHTYVPDLGGLCAHHHDQKTHRGGVLQPGTIPGKLRMTTGLESDTGPDPP